MTIKPFLSDKIVLTEKLNLIKKDEIFEDDIDTAQILNNYFFNTASNFEIGKYCNCDPISDNIKGRY